MNRLFKALGIVTLFTVFAKLSGFFREAVIAGYFGVTFESDAYFIAAVIPTLLFSAFGSAISMGIVPLYVEMKQKNEKEASEFISVVSTFFVLVSFVIAIICFVFSEEITRFIAPSFTNEQIEFTNFLTRIMLPSFVFFILSAIATGVLHANKRFTAPSFVTIPNNLIVIFAVILFSSQFGVTGLAVATVLGVASQFFVQFPDFVHYQIRPNFSFKKYHSDILSSVSLLLPIIVSSVLVQTNQLTDRIFASGLEEGSVAALNYSSRLMWLPLSVIVMSLITVLYPSIVDSVKEGFEKFLSFVFKGIKIIIFSSIPFVLVMIACDRELVELAFKRGAFDEYAADMTTKSFYFYSFGLIFIALREYFSRCVLALKATKLLLVSSIITVALQILMSFIFSKTIGHSGIALSTTLAMLIQSAILFFFLIKKGETSSSLLKNLFVNLGKYLVIFVCLLAVLVPFSNWIPLDSNFLVLFITSMATFVFYFFLLFLFKVDEWSFFRSKLNFKSKK